jgi:peptide/nickel transport system substrate-binding protein
MFGKVFTGPEKRVMMLLGIVAVFSFFFFAYYYLELYGKVVPAYGGTYTEGVVGQPQFVNPVLADTNDINRDLTEIVYSGLLKYDGNGKLINDLAENYNISDDGKVYTVSLKQNASWHDGEKLTADDVVFTVKTIQDPTIKSPSAINWQGVSAQKVNDYTVQFVLKDPYSPFIETLTTGIIPQHIWGAVTSSNFALSEYNLKPIGSGPYKFLSYQKESKGRIISYTLEQNDNYYEKPAYIKKLVFNFYNSEEDAIKDLNAGLIQGMSSVSIKDLDQVASPNITVHKLNLFRYFAIFFNQTENKFLADKNVREALAYSLNKKEIVNAVFSGQADIVNYPIPENLITPPEDLTTLGYSEDTAAKLLENSGWKIKEGESFRSKMTALTAESQQAVSRSAKKAPEPKLEEVVLEIELTIPDLPELQKVGEIVKKHWESIGVKTNLKFVPAQKQEDLQALHQEIIRPRNYQAIIFGHVLLSEPDLFSFWYSTQKKDPGLNLSLYENKDADRLLDEIRSTIDEKKRTDKLNALQKIILKDAPAIFLYNPYYLYPTSSQIQGFDVKNIVLPAKRFTQIEDWYLTTKISL